MMKKVFILILSSMLYSSLMAEEIPYNLISDSLVEKLQKFGLKGLEHYSMNLYNSNDSEALNKTLKNIESFKSNKENCGRFIYYWWYLWAPQSARGFIENVKLTKEEAFNCCLIGESIHRNKQITCEEKEINQYDEWLRNGVPSSVSPNKSAVLRANPKGDFAKYISNYRTSNIYKKTIRVKIGTDRCISSMSSDENVTKLLELLNVSVISPACFVFENSGKSIPMESIVSIKFEEERQPVWTNLISGEYEASVKYNKQSSSWDVMVTKDYLNDFTKDTTPKTQKYLAAVSHALNKLDKKPKKFIKFHLQDSKLYISYSKDGNSYGLDHIELPPIAIIDSSQGGFAKMSNW